jgi:hypothetical protein
MASVRSTWAVVMSLSRTWRTYAGGCQAPRACCTSWPKLKLFLQRNVKLALTSACVSASSGVETCPGFLYSTVPPFPFFPPAAMVRTGVNFYACTPVIYSIKTYVIRSRSVTRVPLLAAGPGIFFPVVKVIATTQGPLQWANSSDIFPSDQTTV